MTNPRKKPSFSRWLSHEYGRLSGSWRKPRGIHSHIRRREKGKIAMPFIGWGAPKATRGLHPSGLKEVVISSPKALEKVDSKTHAVKIAHTVGKLKRTEIVKKAGELKIKVLNA